MYKFISSIYPVLEKYFPSLAKKIAIKAFYTPSRAKLAPEDKDFMSAAGKREVKIRGTKVRYYEWGNHDKYVLLVHGWGGRASQFRPMAARLLKSGYNVVAFDATGHGESSGSESSIFHMGQAIMRTFEKHGMPKAIIGHSLGAVAALMSVINGADPKKLILISAPSSLDEILHQFRTSLKATKQVDNWLKDHSLGTYYMEMENVTGLALSLRLESSKNVLVIHDREDKQVGIQHPYALLQNLPQADTYFSKGLGHSRILREEEIINYVIDYLKGTHKKQVNEIEPRHLATN